MGAEAGKLSELNQLLLGKPSELWVAEGDPGRLAGVRYVLTLDADTALPQGAAARLVGPSITR
jgi:cyclic beta-1,2-glucan synthetase